MEWQRRLNAGDPEAHRQLADLAAQHPSPRSVVQKDANMSQEQQPSKATQSNAKQRKAKQSNYQKREAALDRINDDPAWAQRVYGAPEQSYSPAVSPPTQRILRYFEYEHLPAQAPGLQQTVSRTSAPSS